MSITMFVSYLSIWLIISDTVRNTKADLTLKPGEACDLKVFDNEYNISLVKIDNFPLHKVFKTKISSYIAVMQDVLTNEFYIHDFVNNLKYKALDENYKNVTVNNIVSGANPFPSYSTQASRGSLIQPHPSATSFADNKQPLNQLSQKNGNVSVTSFDINSFLNNNDLFNMNIGGIKFSDFMNNNSNNSNNPDNGFAGFNPFNPSNNTTNNSKLTNKFLNNPNFKQLHRDIPGCNSNSFCAVNQIRVTNMTEHFYTIRLSGKDNPQTYNLEPYSSTNFNKLKDCLYQLEYKSTDGGEGPCHNVKTGCSYILSQYGFTDLTENPLIEKGFEFNPKFELKDQVGVFNDPDDKSILSLVNNPSNSIVIANRGYNTLNLKLDYDSPNNNEGWVQIEPLTYFIFKRKPDTYFISITDDNEAEIYDFEITTGKFYSIRNNCNELFDDFAGTKIPLCPYLDDYDDEIDPIEDPIEDPNNLWVKLKKIIVKLPNIKKIKEFTKLLFGGVFVTNKSGSDVYSRVNTKKIGSEQFVLLKPNDPVSWRRMDGQYLIEFVTADMNSHRFNISIDCSYYFTADKKLVNCLTLKEAEATKNKFSTNELVYFDKIKNDYLKKKINYDDVNAFNIIQPAKKDETVYEYFDNIKPEYIPGNQYTDKDFPPNQSSLRATDPVTGIKRKAHFIHAPESLKEDQIDWITWKKPKDAFKAQYFLFKDEIDPDDIKQGQIGDCYLMSVLAALSQRPDLIKNIFKTQTVNPDGYYELFFYEKGKKKVIFVDDNLIVSRNYFGDFEFAKPNGEELWVMLIEKAYAKYEGGYSNILGGLMYPELQWLTGALYQELRVTNPNAWGIILESAKSKFIMVSGSLAGTGNHFNSSTNGISNGHAYSILDAKEYKDSSKSIKLMKLRNPWGRVEWKGNYNDDSNLWTPQLKTFFGFTSGKDDGIFFMPFEDYIKEFNNLVICKVACNNN